MNAPRAEDLEAQQIAEAEKAKQTTPPAEFRRETNNTIEEATREEAKPVSESGINLAALAASPAGNPQYPPRTHGAALPPAASHPFLDTTSTTQICFARPLQFTSSTTTTTFLCDNSSSSAPYFGPRQTLGGAFSGWVSCTDSGSRWRSTWHGDSSPCSDCAHDTVAILRTASATAALRSASPSTIWQSVPCSKVATLSNNRVRQPSLVSPSFHG